MRGVIFIILSLCLPAMSCAATATWSVQVPKVLYLQHLPNPFTPMTQVDGREVDLQFQVRQGQVQQEQPIYLGVMCNSIDGYQLSLPELEPGLAWEWEAVRLGVGTQWSSQNGGRTLRVTFSSDQELPLKRERANIFELRLVKVNTERLKDGSYRRQLILQVLLP